MNIWSVHWCNVHVGGFSKILNNRNMMIWFVNFFSILYEFFILMRIITYYFIYNWINNIILNLLLSFVEIYINIICANFFEYIGESFGGSHTFTLFIRSYYISDDH